MTGSLTNYAETQILRYLFSASPVTRPSAWWVALHNGDPGETGAANELPELQREQVTFGTPDASSRIFTEAEVNWDPPSPLPPDPDDPHHITVASHWSVWTASSGGNCLGWGDLTEKITSWSRLHNPFETGKLWIQTRGLSTYARNLALNWLFRGVTLTRPNAWWLAMHQFPPNSDGLGGEYPDSGRKAIDFAPVSGASIKNQETILFGRAIDDWPRFSHFSIWTHPGGGQCMAARSLSPALNAPRQGYVRFLPGKLTITVN